jgi:hypothetical protein
MASQCSEAMGRAFLAATALYAACCSTSDHQTTQLSALKSSAVVMPSNISDCTAGFVQLVSLVQAKVDAQPQHRAFGRKRPSEPLDDNLNYLALQAADLRRRILDDFRLYL